ncbi:MAG TPA: ComEA family DNA-binding protein [Candidatus Dormibacteraeota bacterium]|nr:ComEA family DNA-binding protein [Candidatus Dormibacteraeota bacterium]
MIARYVVVAAVLVLASFALWHPVKRPALESAAPSAAAPRAAEPAHPRPLTRPDELVVYVAGAVKRPGIYHLKPGDRNAEAVALAGGFTAVAQPGGVNLAQRAGDGDEILVPAAGEGPARSVARRSRRHSASPPPAGSVDVNASKAPELAAVPGIGRAIAARIVELRRREGNFASLDELLDVSGMTATRLERARPYLREP